MVRYEILEEKGGEWSKTWGRTKLRTTEHGKKDVNDVPDTLKYERTSTRKFSKGHLLSRDSEERAC